MITGDNFSDKNSQPNSITDKAAATTAASTKESSEVSVKTIKSVLAGKGKKEMFKLLALARCTNFPVLFEGPPGTGKTLSVIDYANAVIPEANMDKDLFMIEVDEDTRPSAIKGTLDYKSLAENQEFKLITKAPTAKVVIINEVDKAEGGFRNSLLGFMNEKKIFQGQETVDCNWELFIATCNEIPKEEIGSPFWDRFPIKYKVPKVPSSQMKKILMNGMHIRSYNIPHPTKEQIDKVIIPDLYIDAFVDATHNYLTNRTLSYVPELIKAVSIIWNLSVKQACKKVAALLLPDKMTVATDMMKNLISPTVTSFLNQYHMVSRLKDINIMKAKHVELCKGLHNNLVSGKISQEDYDEAVREIDSIRKKNENA
jgi:MoxR-like ATPase